jgi:hypothetical protein
MIPQSFEYLNCLFTMAFQREANQREPIKQTSFFRIAYTEEIDVYGKGEVQRP